MNIGKAFTFMFEDPDWLRKVGIATLLVLVGLIFSPILIGFIPIIIVTGYALDVTRNVLDGRANPMPAWEDWGHFFNRGIKLVGVLLVWSLPILIMMVPNIIGSAWADNNRGMANTLGVLIVLCSSCLMFLWGILVAVFTPAIYNRLALTDRFGSGFDFNSLWTFTKDNIGNVIVAVLLVLVAGIVSAIIAFLGVIALVIGLLVSIPFAVVWEMLVEAHLYGQVGAASTTQPAA